MNYMVQKWIQIAVTTLIVLSIFALGDIAVYSESSPILITEIFFAGSIQDNCSTCNYDKWIEISNTSNKVIHLSEYELHIGKQRSVLSLASLSINPYSSILIQNKYSSTPYLLNMYGTIPHMYSGKVLQVSNVSSSSKHITLSLIKNGSTIQSISKSNKQVETYLHHFGETKGSIQLMGSTWLPSTTPFFHNNFGTPLQHTTQLPSQPTSSLQTKHLPIETKTLVVKTDPATHIAIQQPKPTFTHYHQPKILPHHAAKVYTFNKTYTTASFPSVTKPLEYIPTISSIKQNVSVTQHPFTIFIFGMILHSLSHYKPSFTREAVITSRDYILATSLVS